MREWMARFRLFRFILGGHWEMWSYRDLAGRLGKISWVQVRLCTNKNPGIVPARAIRLRCEDWEE